MYIILSTFDKAYEQAQSNNFALSFDKDLPIFRKKSLLATRFILKESLKHFYNVDINFAFDIAKHGKPYIKDRNIFFNLSHSSSYIALSLSSDTECGIDIETLKQRNTLDDLAKRVLKPCEYTEFKEKSFISDLDSLKYFYNIWTIKEALLKHSGLGLVGLDNIETHIKEGFVIARQNSSFKILTTILDYDKTYSLSCTYQDIEPQVFIFDGNFKESFLRIVIHFK